ncbi:MAG: hypothetical protein NZ550_00140 [Fimbriimonadales bacterium]|nr:hypothetical protein [Fimbriimonadales bacterium]MDW8052233.1 hypothetical protein [Armatimonadota bacterium]
MRIASNLLVLAVVGLALYQVRLKAPFVADDHSIFYRLQQGGAFGFATRPPTLSYHSLISLQYYLDYALWGMFPLLSHLVNLLWHILCVVLLYFLAVRVLQQWGWRARIAHHAAFLGAFAFVALPANVEAVAWFAARADMVATAAALGTLLLLQHLQQRPNWLAYGGALACFTGGLFCKESLLSFPLVVWLWLRFWGVPRAGWYTAPFVAVLAAYLAIRTATLGGVGSYPQGWETVYKPWQIAINLVAYLVQLAIPATLYGAGRDVWDTFAWVIWIGGALLVALGWRIAPPKPRRFVDWRLLGATVVIALVPVLLFKPSPFYFLNSRYAYLASAFAAIGLGALLHQAMRRWRWSMIGSALVLFAYSAGTVRQADAWRVAGETARSTILSLRQLPADQPLLLLGVPDHYHGAYIWRAGFHDAVRLLLPERASQPIYVASRFTLRTSTEVSIEYAEGVARLTSSEDIFLPLENVATPLRDEPIVLRDRLIIHWSLLQRYQLVGYINGRFVAISQPK